MSDSTSQKTSSRADKSYEAFTEYQKKHPTAKGFYRVIRKGNQIRLEKWDGKLKDDGDELVEFPITVKTKS